MSDRAGKIAHMFDKIGLAGMGDEALVSALTAATRAEAMAAAERLALIGEVIARQCDGEDDDHAHQVIDGWAWAQAQVAAACNLNPYAASKQMRIAQALRDRLPRTAALLASGTVSATVIDAITWRTHLVEDPDALALIDAAIAGEAGEYGAHSEKQLIGAVDVWVEKFDPDAVVRSKRAAKDLYVEFDDKDDPNGVASFWGRLRVTDTKILQQRLEDLLAHCCGFAELAEPVLDAFEVPDGEAASSRVTGHGFSGPADDEGPPAVFPLAGFDLVADVELVVRDDGLGLLKAELRHPDVFGC